jgi:hypothetical protein
MRAFTAWTILKVFCALAVLFVVFRIAIPYLIDAHDDALALAAVALGLATLAGVGWFGFSIWLSVTRFRRDQAAGGQLLPNPKGSKR